MQWTCDLFYFKSTCKTLFVWPQHHLITCHANKKEMVIVLGAEYNWTGHEGGGVILVYIIYIYIYIELNELHNIDNRYKDTFSIKIYINGLKNIYIYRLYDLCFLASAVPVSNLRASWWSQIKAKIRNNTHFSETRRNERTWFIQTLRYIWYLYLYMFAWGLVIERRPVTWSWFISIIINP